MSEKSEISEELKDTVKREFEKQVPLSSQNINGTGGFPLVEKIYLSKNHVFFEVLQKHTGLSPKDYKER